MRLAEFGVLHRNELSGALSGLTRVRRFEQDDAHIFCMPSQIESEIMSVLDFFQHTYGIFGFEFHLALSTMPDNHLGEVAQWEVAERQLSNALNKFGKKWELNPKDGAFYGPKIDISVTDCMKRKFQCATIQLDFQLPIRFGLEYQPPPEESGPGPHRPVILHRAILGSVERMFAILTEHVGGKWPFWLSPRQVMIVPITKSQNEVCAEIKQKIHEAGYFVEVDISGKRFEKKICEAQLAQFNFILVVGQQEADNGTVNVRTRDNQVHGARKLDDVLADFAVLVRDKVRTNENEKLDIGSGDGEAAASSTGGKQGKRTTPAKAAAETAEK